jgi:signal transduction histidine kinase
MPSGNDIFAVYIGAVLTVLVIVTALGAALVIYQRRFLALHREYTRKLIVAHEDERAYVAREVHDDALQRVAIIQHDIGDWIDARGEMSALDRVTTQAFRDELADLGVMLRRVAHRLHPAIIEQGGLFPALTQLAEDTSRISAVDVTTRLPSEGSEQALDRERSLIVFRIAQEALRNVTKHSGAARAEIAVEAGKETLVMTITDHGRGFDSGDASKAAGLGMISMSERARLANGTFSVWSKPGSGTTIRVTVPFKA